MPLSLSIYTEDQDMISKIETGMNNARALSSVLNIDNSSAEWNKMEKVIPALYNLQHGSNEEVDTAKQTLIQEGYIGTIDANKIISIPMSHEIFRTA